MSTDIEAALKDPLQVSEADLAKLMAEASGEDPATVEPEGREGEGQPEQTAQGTDEAPAQREAQPGPNEPAEQPADVLTRDGKNRIPYSVLESERRRAQEAAQRATAAEQLAQLERAQREVLERQLAELNEKAEAVTAEAAGGGKDATADVEQIIGADELDAIREEAPELAKVLDSLIGEIKTMRARADAANQRVAQMDEQRQQETLERHRDMVEKAIGNNAKLVYARSEKPDVFNAIVEVDDWFRQQPAARGLSLDERFAKSVAMYEAAHGHIAVPGNAKPVQQKVSDAAAEAIAKAQGTVPNTLSDLPGGAMPARSDTEAIGALSAQDLTARMMDMTPDQIDKLLARLSI